MKQSCLHLYLQNSTISKRNQTRFDSAVWVDEVWKPSSVLRCDSARLLGRTYAGAETAQTSTTLTACGWRSSHSLLAPTERRVSMDNCIVNLSLKNCSSRIVTQPSLSILYCTSPLEIYLSLSLLEHHPQEIFNLAKSSFYHCIVQTTYNPLA